MFYSHTILAKKAPLGTVWIAAHLERRIKKHQIDDIDIATYTERIMFPEVPIALRLSAHLLLGIVRIYSLKVNYLLQDCNNMRGTIRTVFPNARIDLPSDADRAPFELLTKPDTFRLDAFELDVPVPDSITRNDHHTMPYHQVTEGEEDPYVAINLAEDDGINPSIQPALSNAEAEPMNMDVMPPFDIEILEDLVSTPREAAAAAAATDKDPGPTKLADPLPEDIPEMEIMRDAVHNFERNDHLDSGGTNTENDGIGGLSVPTVNGKGSPSPIMTLLSDLASLTSRMDAGAPTALSPYDPDINTTEISRGQSLPDFAIQPSPPAEKQQPKTRKRKQSSFDVALVMSNMEIKKQLEDTSKLVCKRRKLPCSALDSWRFHKVLKNDSMFQQPLLSGMCANLLETFERHYPLSRIHSAPVAPSSGPTSSELEIPDTNIEFEQPRFGNLSDANIPGHILSPPEREENIPTHPNNLGSSPDIGTLSVPEISLTFKKHPSAELFNFEPETPLFYMDNQSYQDDSVIPERHIDDFDFLESSNNTSVGFGEFEADAMSERTRAVARYFKDLSPATESLENHSGNLSLNKILMGKRRKQCAQMFFETLVLKNNGFIDVRQEEAYADILVSPTPALTEAKF